MADLEVTVAQMDEQRVYGLWRKSNDRTLSGDIRILSEKYHATVKIPEGKVFPYFVLSRNYEEQSKDFELLIGSTLCKDGLECFVLPAGEYARITVRPKLGFLWGAAIGEAKRYFYTKWIRESPFEALNMEYEYHTEESLGKHPTITIVFAVQRKEIRE